MAEPIRRTCAQCRERFEITVEEQTWFAELARLHPDQVTVLPWHCEPCPRERRAARLVVVDNGRDESIVCVDCGETFTFGGRDREYWAQRGWPRPLRCRECRRARAGIDHG